MNVVTLEKASKSLQRQCQKQYQINNNEEKTQQFMDKTISIQLANM